MRQKQLYQWEYGQRALELKLKESIVGRDQEIETIKMQFDKVLEGNTALAIIAGDVGCGKTTLIKAVLADLSKLNGTCVYGKFEQF
ncbi:MAG: ATP-binding protein, partial [Clostridiaceae bacterium]|nr:ATP-binding protein [Clostridiaceae bacterium]